MQYSEMVDTSNITVTYSSNANMVDNPVTQIRIQKPTRNAKRTEKETIRPDYYIPDPPCSDCI